MSTFGSFDARAALAQLEGDKEGLSELFSIFQRTSAQQLEQLRQALQQGDAEKLESVAHCLKGSLGLFAAEPAAAMARAIELHARAADLPRASEALVELEAACSQLNRDLVTFFGTDQ